MNHADLEKEVKRLVHLNHTEKGYVCAVDVLLQLNYLTQKDYKDWRFGRVDYLEKVCNKNLTKLTLINKLIAKFSTELNLKKSLTGYYQFGRGIKQRLRFSTSGEKTIEDRYSTHYIDTNKMMELKEKKTSL